MNGDWKNNGMTLVGTKHASACGAEGPDRASGAVDGDTDASLAVESTEADDVLRISVRKLHDLRKKHALPYHSEPHDVLTLDEAAGLLRISTRTVQRHVRSGGIPCWRNGGHPRFSRARLLALLDGIAPAPTRWKAPTTRARQQRQPSARPTQENAWYNDLGTHTP